jgi:two-component system, LytTR family, response regulator LytT
MKVLIIEDEQPAAKQLTKMLQKANSSITIIETIDSVEASVKWLNTFPSPDAIFMDIQIADGLSFDIFNHTDINCPVVFTTAFDQYAIKAFRVNALDYLLKPIDEDELNDVINKLKTKGTPQYSIDFLQNLMPQFTKPIAEFKSRFLIKQGTTLNFVETNDIAFFFSEDGLTHFYSIHNKKHLIEQTLDELEHQLNPSDYFRINRKIIVSIKSIKKISPHFNSRLKLELNPHYLEDIFVARERVSDFKTWLGG